MEKQIADGHLWYNTTFQVYSIQDQIIEDMKMVNFSSGVWLPLGGRGKECGYLFVGGGYRWELQLPSFISLSGG